MILPKLALRTITSKINSIDWRYQLRLTPERARKHNNHENEKRTSKYPTSVFSSQYIGN